MQIKITLRLHFTPIRISKINKITDNKEKIVEKEEHLFTTGQSESWCSHPENQFGEFSEKQKADLPCDPDIPHLGKCPKDSPCYSTDTCPAMIIDTLGYLIASKGKQPKVLQWMGNEM